MYIVIVGAGRVGYFLAEHLHKNKHAVAIIEKDKNICEGVSERLDVLVINGDACDPQFLEQAGVARAHVLAAVTGDDEDNFVICQLAKEKFGVSRTIGMVNNHKNARVFNELGIDIPIDATAIIAKIIEEEVSFSDFVNLLSFKRGKLAIVRVDLPDDSPIINKKIQDLHLPPSSVLVSIVRGGEVIIPKGDTALLSRDDIIALTLIENEQQLISYLVGKI